MKLPEVKQTLLDRAIEVFSPQRALERARARTMLAVMGGGSGYVGADRTRQSQRFWNTRNTSADQATLPALPDLRAGSRDLLRNNPLAAGAINTVTTNVVGTGMGVQPQIAAKRLKMTADQAVEWQAEARELFEMWAENPLWCDITAKQSFYDMQDLAFRSAMESGDAFALLPMQRTAGEPFQTKVQLIEADRICNPKNAARTQTLAAGIEVDSSGRSVRVHIARQHPGGIPNGQNEWDSYLFYGEKTGRRNVLHLMTMLRPGQRRGVPYLAPVIESIKQLGDYTDNEVRAAVVSSLFTVFVKKEIGEDGTVAGERGAPAPGATAANEVKMGNGAIIDLAEGEDVQFANPTRPNTAFDPFVQAVLRQVGVALEIPFELLIKHFTSSYSAARAALLEAWRFFRKRRAWLATHFCQPIYEAVIWEAVATGKLRAPGFLRDPMLRAAWCRADWIGDGQGHIQPLQEANAARVRVEMGLTSLQKESVSFDGSNWEDNHQQQMLESTARKRDGLKAEAPAAPVAPAAAPAPAEPDEDPDKEESDDPDKKPDNKPQD